MAIVNHSDWKCQICNIKLGRDFHADHIIPFSKGGITEVTNGQALCPSCNLSKGNKIMTKIDNLKKNPYAWQEDAKDAILEAFNTKRVASLFAVPASGKTIAAGKIAKQMLKDGTINKILFVVPSSELTRQIPTDLSSIGLNLNNVHMYHAESKYDEYDGYVMTYSGAHSKVEDLIKGLDIDKFLVVADEYHWMGDTDDSKWGESFKRFGDKAVHILGMTGTPFRTDGDKLPYFTYSDHSKPGEAPNILADTDYSYTKSQAIANGTCRSVKFQRMNIKNVELFDADTGVSCGTTPSLKKAFKGENGNTMGNKFYKSAIRDNTAIREMFNSADKELLEYRQVTPNAAGLIVCPDISKAYGIQKELKDITGIEFPVIVSNPKGDIDSEQEEKRKIRTSDKIDAFRKASGDDNRWLITVQMVSEGVDIKRLRVLMYLSSSTTKLRFIQILGRIERLMRMLGVDDKNATLYYFYNKYINKFVAELESEIQSGEGIREQKEKEEQEEFDGDSDGDGQVEPRKMQKYLMQYEGSEETLFYRGSEISDEIKITVMMIKENMPEYSTLDMDMLLMLSESVIKGDMVIRDNSNKMEPDFVKVEPLFKREEALRKEIKDLFGKKMRGSGLTDSKAYGVIHSYFNKKSGAGSHKVASLDELELKKNLMLGSDFKRIYNNATNGKPSWK